MTAAAAGGRTCPQCRLTSHHPTDIAEGYCGRCHDWTVPPAPTSPAELPHTLGLTDLVAIYHRHVDPLVDAHHGLGPGLRPGELAGHAIAALAVQHALAERALYTRWVNVRDALRDGATVEQVATAMGLDVDEVTVGLRSWADGQLQLRRDLGPGWPGRHTVGLSEDEHEQVLALLT